MRHATNHLRLSRKVRDPVLAISSDGVKATATLRNDYLNRADIYIQEQLRLLGNQSIVERFLQGLLKPQTITAFSTDGFSVPEDFSFAVSCKDGTTQFDQVEGSQKYSLNSNPLYERSVFLVSGGKTYAYNRGKIVASGTGELLYIQSDQQTLTDVNPAIDSIWDSTLVDIAATFFWEDSGTMTSQDSEARRKLAVKAVLG